MEDQQEALDVVGAAADIDVIATAVSGREKMAQALQRFAGLEEPGALPKAAE